jgi:hypothetical protein
MSIDVETVRERQRRVSLSGGKWEEYVRLFLTEKLRNTDIEVIVGKYEEQIKKRSRTLWKMLSLPLKVSTAKEYIWGDIDLVAIKGELPITVISCKTSLHGRLTETLFWSLLYKMLTRIKVVLATCDAGSGKPEELKSEWGTPENPSDYRLLAESYLDGVYVENVPEFSKLSEPTVLGGIVRPLSELPSDIIRWSEETSKFICIRRSGLEHFI